MTPNIRFNVKVAVLFKGDYYSNWYIVYCPTADNLFT